MKKLLSFFLCLIMILSVMPSAVFAAVTEYTQDELTALNLEVALKTYHADSALSIAAADRLDTTPSKYLFKTFDTSDTKEYILLKSVNANEGDGYFVMVNDCTDTSGVTAYHPTAGKYIFDADDTDSIAYKMNQSAYINTHFPLMKDYINTHTWYTEAGVSNAYSTNAKIALISLTEYEQNADRIGVLPATGAQWWTRTPHSSFTRVWQFLKANKKIDAGSEVSSAYAARTNRPCFYLSENFFKNVKIDEAYLTDDAEVTKILKTFDLATLQNIGYSDALLVKWGLLKGSTEIKTLTISGETQVGCTLLADYELKEGFEQEEYTQASWEYSSSSDEGFVSIENATGKEFTVTSDLNEKYVRVNITLGNIDGPGETYTSEAVYIKTYPPVIENVKISGDAYTQNALTVSFNTVSGAPDLDKTIVKWYWLDEIGGTLNLIDDAAEFTYTVADEYADKYISASVIPANTYEIFGEEVFSEDFLYIIASVNEANLETKLVKVDSTGTITAMGKEILDTVSPAKYTFTIDRNVKTEDGISDTKEYILLKNVNAKDGDGYFVMLSDGALATNVTGSAVTALKEVYPGTYNGEDASVIAKNYESPSKIFNANDEKSIAYYLNDASYIKAQFPIMYEGGYINEHTWYTEQGIAANGEKAYASNAKIALISVTEYIENIERIGTRVASVTWTPTIFQTRTPHPSVATKNHSNNEYTAPAMWHITSNKAAAAESLIYLWQTLERPVFYLSEDFFKNVKISANENSALADVLKELMSYEEMIALGYTDDELNKMGISSSYPTGKNAAIKGHFFAGNTVYADYDFTHTDKAVKEGNTKYQWYVEDNGTYKEIDGETSLQYVIKSGDVGKKLKVEITPYDENGYMAKKISAESNTLVSAKSILTFTNPSVGSIESMQGVTSVNASVKIEATQNKNVKLYVGVYNKNTNKCVDLSTPVLLNLTPGTDTYNVSSNTFAASEDNYIKLFVLDENNRPLFGMEYFKR